MDYLNLPLAASVISWFMAQLIKTLTYSVKNKRLDFERFVGPGGMPSAHSATVCALAITVSRTEGIKSAEFALAMVLAMIVMYDAIGVRRSAGLHAREINRIRRILSEYEMKSDEKIEQIPEDNDEFDEDFEDYSDKQKDLKEILGHTPIEVIFGALLGILVGMLFSM